MTLVDSLDSILMLYAYAGPSQDPTISKFALTFENDQKTPLLSSEEQIFDQELLPTVSAEPNAAVVQEDGTRVAGVEADTTSKVVVPAAPTSGDCGAGPAMTPSRQQVVLASKANTISSLSITLTLLSILVALR